MSVINSEPLLLGADAAAGGYQIERSLRFNSRDSAYLSKNFGSAGNRKTWTWAGWVKRSGLGSGHIFTCTSGTTDSTYLRFWFFADALYLGGYSTDFRGTTALFRDTSAWMHLVCAVDTTQATGANRVKIYANGTQITTFQISNDPALNADLAVNQAASHFIGSDIFFNGYIADAHFIDGQALAPSSFGEFDTNGVWQPKAYTGSYGTNGFHLPFSDNSTAAALGTDTSGNSNTWTVNNISVTAGAGNDSLVDSPTNYGTDTGAGGEVRGNYCTLNPLDNGGLTLANGNLDTSRATASWANVRTTLGISSGKWYWEITPSSTVNGSNIILVGIQKQSGALSTDYLGKDSFGWSYSADSGNKNNNNVTTAYGSSFTNGDVIGVALDADTGALTFYKNNTSQGQAFSGLTSGPYFPAIGLYGTSSASANFGQRPFAYTAPSGFKALCTANLPSTTITTSGSYTGNGVADGPFVYLNGVPTAMTVNGNAVTFGTRADKLSNGFKVRTTSTTYNQNASTYNYTITTTGDPFKRARAQTNP